MADLYTITTLADGTYTTAGNWIGGSAPVANDDASFQYDASQALAGSDQSATELDNIDVLPTCTGNAGTADTYLQLDQGAANTVVYAGTGIWYLDMGTSGSASVRVDRTRSASNGNAGLYFKNNTNAITLFDVAGGVVRLVEANITTLVVRNGATVYVDAASTVVTIQNDGGTVIDYGAAVTAWIQNSGTTTKYGADAATLTTYGGTFYNDSTGTLTATMYSGILDCARDARAKNLTLTHNGGTAIVGANVTLTDTLNTTVTITG